MTVEQLQQGYRQLSCNDYLDDRLETNVTVRHITVYVIMNMINANPEHIKIEGIFLDEEKAKNIAQNYDFAWVDDHILTIS